MSRTSFIYLNTKHYDGTVFVTQIADWLRLYSENGITFMYLLKNSVHQKRDNKLMPSDETFANNIFARLTLQLNKGI